MKGKARGEMRGGLRRSATLVAALALALVCAALAAHAQAAPTDPKIKVLSNRADLISGGDALLEVKVPKGVRPAAITVRLNGRNVTRRFAVRPNGRFQGLLKGLRNGKNVVSAKAPGGRADRLRIRNHPNGGPVFSGPQVKPWRCQAGAVDRKCNQPASYGFLYRSTNPLKPGFQPYDPKSPPGDVATTTTDEGRTVPFIDGSERSERTTDEYNDRVTHS